MEGEEKASSEKTAPTKRKDEIEVDKNDRDDDEIGHALVGRSVRKNFPASVFLREGSQNIPSLATFTTSSTRTATRRI